ncbi:SAP domain-containing protein [Pedobacter sp. KACC 23697]|uniref:SAP domain-containing protein n=1 Tax=Pedobacter sp. KACC 23697 TaxID=3149230 RepID=A0AAU7K8N1_9SPHI
MEYKKLETTRLRALCKEKNLDDKGNKEVLIRRLKGWDLQKEPQDKQLALVDVGESKPQSNTGSKRCTLFIHLKASNISHYFNAGIIYPLVLEESEIYIKENRKKDIFTLFPNNILLSPGPVNSFLDDDALLDILSDEIELIEIPGTPLLRSETPIPLSRIKGIVFNSAAARSTFISSAKTFPDFFVEEKICFVSTRLASITIDMDNVKIGENAKIDQWHDIMDRYDKLLGMFAFMKNSGVFFSDRESIFEEYTHNYLAALSVVNAAVVPKSTRDIGLYKYIIFPGEIELTTVQRLLFQRILKAIYENVDLDIDFAITILNAALASELSTIEEQKELGIIIELFERLQEKQISYKDVAFHGAISKNYPVLALLFLSRFPNKSRQHTDKQAVRNNFLDNNSPLSKSVSEFLLSVLGLYYGYKTMIKEDTNINLVDPFFASVSQKYQSIKFRLTSFIDRFVMESAYWFAINGLNINKKFSFLDYQRPEFKDASTVRAGAYEYQNFSYSVLGVPITVFRRINKIDILFELLDKAYSYNVPASSVLVHHMISNFGMTKMQLFELIKENASKIDLDDINQLMEFDKRPKTRK